MDRHTTTFFLLLLLVGISSVASAHVERYAVNTTVSHRFARTHILIDVVNEGECPTVLGLALQLPTNARVKTLTMDRSDFCSIDNVVKSQAEAQEDFDAKAQQGESAALLQAHALGGQREHQLLRPRECRLLRELCAEERDAGAWLEVEPVELQEL